MNKYGFTKRERKTYFKDAKFASRYGRVFAFNTTSDVEWKPPYLGQKDYIKLYILDLNGTLEREITIRIKDVKLDTSSNTFKLNIGQHLRDAGLIEGDYRVFYKFLRKVAGDDTQFFVTDSDGEVWNGDYEVGPEESWDTDEDTGELIPTHFKLIDDVVDLTQPVFVKPFTYRIAQVSPSGREVIIQPDANITNQVYNDNLLNVNANLVYVGNSANTANETLEFSGTEKNILQVGNDGTNPNSSIKFDKSMEGREIVLENFFLALIPNHPIFKPKRSGKIGISGNHQTWYNNLKPWKDISSDFITKASELNSFFRNTETAKEGRLKSQKSVLRPYTSIPDYFYDIFQSTNARELLPPEEFLPKDYWLATGDIRRKYNHRGSKARKHTHWYGTDDGTSHPKFRYDEATDSSNIDWNVTNTASPKTKDYTGINMSTPYQLGKNMQHVYIDCRLQIQEVKNESTIVVKNNIKEQYQNLRSLGYWVVDIGSVDKHYWHSYNSIGTDFKLDEVDWDNVSTTDFYIKSKFNDTSRFKTFLKYQNDYYLILNSKLSNVNPLTAGSWWTDSESDETNGLYLKLHKPLRDNVLSLLRDNNESNDSGFTIVEELVDDYTDNVSLIPTVSINNTFLLPADFDNQEDIIEYKPTEFKTHDGLLGTDGEMNRDIERKLVSGSLLDVKINVDYQKTTTDLLTENDDTGFGNFVHFSNAQNRLKGFKKKLELIESHSADSRSLETITSATTRIQEIENKRQRVVNSFDAYETFMYYESSSYVSSSAGQFHDTCWPKENSTAPYTFAPTTSSLVTGGWYDNMISSASTYDFNNLDSLRNSLPEHIYADTENNTFLEFMDMVGQQFDEVWTYTKHFTDINKKVSSLSEGISKDVARHYAKALGLNLTSGNDLLDLPSYLFGKNSDGTALYDSAQEEVTEEIWKRILGNLPFFIKTKGTVRALKGLLNCYGIPSSMLRVREYGGPDKGTRVSYEIKRKFTRALDFKAGQYIKSQWKADSDSLYPDTVEFRFRTPYSAGSSGSMVIAQKENDWAISLQDNDTTDNYGHLRFKISASGFDNGAYITSSLLPFYNDEMWSVMLTRKSGSISGSEFQTEQITSQSSYELTVKQYDSTRQRIIYQDSQSLLSHTASLSSDIDNITGSKLNASYTGSGHVYLGGLNTGFGSRFSGSLMEYRVWSEPLSSSIFDNHVTAPKAYNGNTYSSSYEALLVRYELNDNLNLQTSPAVSSSAHKKDWESGSFEANGFTGNFYRTIEDQEKLRIPNIGPNRRNATKIRIEDNKLTGQLSPELSREESSQDFAPVDSEVVGIYLSPTDVINEDIIYSLADFNFDDYIGDPRDEFKYSYRTLEQKRHEYFKRYLGSNNFWDYLRILSYYDKSIFRTLKQFIPARAKARFGNLIEPNILERPKEVIGKKPETENVYYENAGHYDLGVKVSRHVSGSHDNIYDFSGAYPNYDSVIVVNTGSRGTNIATLVHIDKLNPNSAEPTTYATASVTFGGENLTFAEAFQPTITGSKIALINQEKEFYYTSSLADSIAKGYGAHTKWGNVYVWSSSFQPTDLEVWHKDTISDRLFYEGTKTSRLTDITGEDPVEITFTSPTSITTQTEGESKLRVD